MGERDELSRWEGPAKIWSIKDGDTEYPNENANSSDFESSLLVSSFQVIHLCILTNTRERMFVSIITLRSPFCAIGDGIVVTWPRQILTAIMPIHSLLPNEKHKFVRKRVCIGTYYWWGEKGTMPHQQYQPKYEYWGVCSECGTMKPHAVWMVDSMSSIPENAQLSGVLSDAKYFYKAWYMDEEELRRLEKRVLSPCSSKSDKQHRSAAVN